MLLIIVLMENKEKIKRVKNLFFIIIITTCLLIFYYFLYINFPQIALKCIFFEFTGLRCPGCGISHMLSNFIHFNFANGIKCNFFLGITLPLLIFIFIYYGYLYVNGRKSDKNLNVICCIYIILLILWGIIRNIYKV